MAYAPIILPADLSTTMYQEIITDITRDNEGIVEVAIDNAISEVKTYLSRYDLVQLFGSQPEDTAATFSDPYLTRLVKDVAAWQLISLANPNINYEHIRTRYEDAITALKAISKGTTNPQWPYLDTTGLSTPPGISVSVFSGTKRDNHF